MALKRILKDFNAAAFWAGISTFLFMVFGALTLQIAVVERFHLPQSVAQSWIVVTWLTPGIVSLIFILRFRQPLGLGWTIPGLVYIGSLAGKFGFEEILAADLIAGLAIAVLGLAGFGSRIIRLIPMPILMSMFAASIIEFFTRMVDAAVVNVALAAPMIGVYLLGRGLNMRRVPPVGLSVVVGAVLVIALSQWHAAPLDLHQPALAVPGLKFSLQAVLTISLPMVVLVLGLGNGQGLGFLVAQGYRVPADGLTVAVGLMTVLNAFFGGHPAAMTRTSSAMLGGPAAGPFEKRYWAALTTFTLVIGASVASGLLISLVAILPVEYILVVAGLAILPSFEDALTRGFEGKLRLGSVVAFGVTLSTSLTLFGIPAAFWALVAGVGVSFLVERAELEEYWNLQSDTSHPAQVDGKKAAIVAPAAEPGAAA